MVVDVVQVKAPTGAAQLRRVVQFVCGNALVCDTIKQARSVAFDGPVRHKVQMLQLLCHTEEPKIVSYFTSKVFFL